MKPIAPNTLIQNRYLIVHLIGKGGMGEVYLAVDQRLGSAIALKRTFFSDDATLGHAFEREARTLARLRHPVLPKVSDHFTEEGTQYLVMEHISGEDLSKRLETAEKLFPISWVLFWADQLLDALNYLHSHEPPIVHRDIKPQNLKLTDENHIVLLDFGLSKNSVGETRVTSAGSIVGYTPHYAPMEQIRGTGTDARSDLYSLSATLYQILTNNVPPDALTRADSLINGLPDPVPLISNLNPEVSRAVSDVILKGMTISQEQRYKSAREMQKALRDAYAQRQSDMMVSTVVLDTATAAEAPQSPPATEITDAPLAEPLPTAAPVSPTDYNSGANGTNANVAASPNTADPDSNFDQTVRYDSTVPEPSAKQSDIKTEVFLAGSSAAISSVQTENTSQTDSFSKAKISETSDDSKEEPSFFTDEETDQAANFSPGATVPLFTFDKNSVSDATDAADGFDSSAERETNKSAPKPTFIAVENGSLDQLDYLPTPVVAAPKSGKGLMIGGGLFALLVLAIGAAGIGWFTLRDSGATTEISQPTPLPEATVAPTVAPTAEPTVEVVTETETLTNSEVITPDNTNRAINPTVTPRVTTTTPRIETTVVQPTPPRVPTGPTPGKPTPTKPPVQTKATPDRTIIRQ